MTDTLPYRIEAHDLQRNCTNWFRGTPCAYFGIGIESTIRVLWTEALMVKARRPSPGVRDRWPRPRVPENVMHAGLCALYLGALS